MPERFCRKQNGNAFFCPFSLNSDDVVTPVFWAKWKALSIQASGFDVLLQVKTVSSVPSLLRNRRLLSCTASPFAACAAYRVHSVLSPIHTHATVEDRWTDFHEIGYQRSLRNVAEPLRTHCHQRRPMCVFVGCLLNIYYVTKYIFNVTLPRCISALR
jgi:hypothetical protein